MNNTQRIIDLLKLIKELVGKGMPGYYVSAPMQPVQGCSLEVQEAMFMLKTIESDLPNMKLEQMEKDQLSSAVNELKKIYFDQEQERIASEAIKALFEGINNIKKNRTSSEGL